MTTDPLSNLAASAPASAPARTHEQASNGHWSADKLEAWLQEYSLEFKAKDPYEDGWRWILRECPFNTEHKGTSAAVFLRGDGTLGFKCQHQGCVNNHWHELRELKEPGYKDRHNGHRDPTDLADTTPANVISTHFNRTDSGQAEYFTAIYSDRLRYDHRRGRFLEWAGTYWREDTDGQVIRLALKAARERYKQTVNINDLETKKAESKFAIDSEQRGKLDAVTSIASNLHPIADSGELWDADPWLFGVANGVVDLRTGKLRPGRQSDRITMRSPVVFDDTASAPRFLSFLAEVFSGDQNLIDFLKRYFGYCLTGSTREQKSLIGHGHGANGKGRLSAILRYELGDYAYNAPFSTFELNNRNPIPNDLAALVGRRFVTSSETIEGTRLNEARMKMLAGEDPVTARFLNHEFFTFMPQCKLFLTVNHRPRVLDDTYGFWRKVCLVPFNRQFKGSSDDNKLLDKLIAEAPGILNWLLEGCLEWQDKGLGVIPDSVAEATAEYQADSDPLSAFLEFYSPTVPAGTLISGKDFFAAYRAFCQDQGMSDKEMLSNTAFGRRMGQKFKKTHARGGAVYADVGTTVTGLVTGLGTTDQKNMVDATLLSPRGSDMKNLSQPINPSPDYSEILGMSVDAAIELWTSQGAPIIFLGPAQTTEHLDVYLSRPGHPTEQLAKVAECLAKWRTEQ